MQVSLLTKTTKDGPVVLGIYDDPKLMKKVIHDEVEKRRAYLRTTKMSEKAITAEIMGYRDLYFIEPFVLNYRTYVEY